MNLYFHGDIVMSDIKLSQVQKVVLAFLERHPNKWHTVVPSLNRTAKCLAKKGLLEYSESTNQIKSIEIGTD